MTVSQTVTNAFKDADGNEWTIRLSVNAMDRVKEQTGVDLVQPFPTKEPTEDELSQITEIAELSVLMRLQLDAVLFGKVLFGILSPQCESKEISRDSFLDALDGGAIGRASKAFWPLYADFFRQAGQDALAQMIVAAGESYRILQDGIHFDQEELMDKMKKGAQEVSDQFAKMAGS